MSLLSASKIELAMRCLGAFTLPWRQERNQWSDGGLERHSGEQASIDAGDVPDALAERWPDLTWRAEVAFAYDVATGQARELGVAIGRDYARFDLTPFEVVGTADAIGLSPGRVVVHDKKSFDDVTRAADNPQLGFLALAAARVYLPSRIEVAISHELRALDVAELDSFDLDVTAHRIRKLMLDVAKARGDARAGLEVPFVTGRQCRWCNAFGDCPKQRDLVDLVKHEDETFGTTMETTLPLLTDENAPEVYQLYKAVSILHKRIGQSLYAKAADRPIAIGGGKMFGRVTKPGNEKLDGAVVHEVVTARYGREVADSVVTMSATKKRIKEALSEVAGKGGLAAAERWVLAEVRRLGGATQEEKESIEEFTPQLAAVND